MIFIFYTYYKESFWANVVECSALLCPIIAAAICLFVLDVNSIGILPCLPIVAASFAAAFLLKRAAKKVSTYTINKKISEDVSYAKYIAVTYPDMELLCIELNPDYAECGKDIPYEDFHPKRKRNGMIIHIVGLGVLLAVFAALVIWCINIQNEFGI